MPFCARCGSPVEGQFCTNCGAPMSSEVAPGGQAAVPPAPVSGAPAGPKKKTSPVVWVLLGCLGLILIGAVILIWGGLFVIHKAQQAGVDPELWRRNPGLAAAKMVATLNPDLEIVSVDEERGLITLRDKRHGKTVTVNFEDVRQGRIVFQSEAGEKVEIRGSPGSVEVKSSEGTMRIGAAKLPDWLPLYPGLEQVGSFAAQGKEGESGTASFKSRDPIEKVAGFYEEKLKEAGMETKKQALPPSGTPTLIILSGVDEGRRRTAQITVAAAEGGATVGLTFETKE